MKLEDVKKAWNEQADEYNQWPALDANETQQQQGDGMENTILKYTLSGDGLGLNRWFRSKDGAIDYYHIHSDEFTELEQWLHGSLNKGTVKKHKILREMQSPEVSLILDRLHTEGWSVEGGISVTEQGHYVILLSRFEQQA